MGQAPTVLVLTRERMLLPHLRWVTVVPITTPIRGLRTEVAVSLQNGLDKASVLAAFDLEPA